MTNMQTMEDVMFPRFRADRGDYEKSQQEWKAVFDQALKPIAQVGWKPWLNDPFNEGTPIFSRVKTSKRQGVVVNQILPSDDSVRFRAYLDDFASESDENHVAHLVIHATLTDSNKEKSKKLMNLYLVHKIPPAEMAKICAEYTE